MTATTAVATAAVAGLALVVAARLRSHLPLTGPLLWRGLTDDLPLQLAGTLAAAALGLRQAQRLVGRYPARHRSRGLVVSLSGALAGWWTAVAIAAVRDRHELTSLLSMGRDVGTALMLTYPVAAALVAWATRPRIVVPELLARPASVRFTAAAVAGLLATSLVVAVPVVAGTGAPSIATSSDPGDPCPADRAAEGSPFHKTFFVKAIDVKIPLNNYGDYDPEGKMYAARHTAADLDALINGDDTANSVIGIRHLEDSFLHHNGKVTPGLQDDSIQTLVMRVSEGDCVDVNFTNETADGNPYGFHVDGLSYQAGSSGDAVGVNPASDTRASRSHAYRFWIPEDQQLEGGHYIQPGPDYRAAIDHGLFGMMIVEPPGSIALDQRRTPPEIAADKQIPDREQVTGQEAMVIPCVYAPTSDYCEHYGDRHLGVPAQPFRDNATIFHEVGDESYQISNRDGSKLPFVDPFTSAYRPGARAVNYRSDPFYNRLGPSQGKDESLAYDSYTFGDPATPVNRAYEADPMKLRLMHGGAEMFHVYHLHSGGLHWSLNPGADPSFDYGDTALTKQPTDSERQQSTTIDAQSLGPGETFNAELNRGAGGPQHAVGDFTFHCHIAEHYFAGMWGIRRVFDTLQPDLWELPDDDDIALIAPAFGANFAAIATAIPAGPHGIFGNFAAGVGDTRNESAVDDPDADGEGFIPAGVSSVKFVQMTEDSRNDDPLSTALQLPDGSYLTSDNVDAWVRQLLPPPTHGTHNDTSEVRPDGTWKDGLGPRGQQDAATMDWVIDRTVRPDVNPRGLPLVLGELEMAGTAPDLPDQPHPSAFPGDVFVRVPGEKADRPIIWFNASPTGEYMGRPAYPIIRTHFLQRPPFAPNGHSGSPSLGEVGIPKTPAGQPIFPCAPGVQPLPDAPCTPAPAQPNAYAGRTNAVCPYDSVYQQHIGGDPNAPFDTSADSIRRYNVVESELPVKVTKDAADQAGLLFLLATDKERVLRENGVDPVTGEVVDPGASVRNPNPPSPLALRGNVNDCIDLTLTVEESDDPAVAPTAGGVNGSAFSGYAKGNLHIHHVQFDPTGSDGSVIGFNYETSIRPYKIVDHQLTSPSAKGATTLRVGPSKKSETKLLEGEWIAVGQGTDDIEIRQVKNLQGNESTGYVIGLTRGLDKPHPAGQWAGTEFLQSQWFLDEPLDNVFFHDHTDGIHGWGHGAIGQIAVEPRGATYWSPTTGLRMEDGRFEHDRDPSTVAPTDPIADIHVDPADAPPITGHGLTCAEDTIDLGGNSCQRETQLAPKLVEGSFREMLLWQVGNNPVVDATLNLRAEPLANRSSDPAKTFSSATAAGDPITPLPRAYAGDPVVIRDINVSQTADTFHVDGHRFFIENRLYDPLGNVAQAPADTIHIGVSERFTLIMDGGAGSRRVEPAETGSSDGLVEHQAGDFLYMTGQDRKMREGAWGIFRVEDQPDPTLQPLPGYEDLSAALPADEPDGPDGLCPDPTEVKSFAISAVDVKGVPGVSAAFVPTDQVADVTAAAARGVPPDPLTVHVVAGDCIKVEFTNQRSSDPATFHVDELQHKLASSGIDIGRNPAGQAVAPGQSKTYWFFADSEKIGSALISDFGGTGHSTGFGKITGGARELSGVDGLYGAFVVSPRGSWFTTQDGTPTDFGTVVDVHNDTDPQLSTRDATLFFADTEKQLGADFMPYPLTPSDPGLINYRSAGRRPDGSNAFSSLANGDPKTVVVNAVKGDPLVVHVVGTPGSDQPHVFSMGGLPFEWDHYLRDELSDPLRNASNAISLRGFGPWMTFDAYLKTGVHDAVAADDPAAAFAAPDVDITADPLVKQDSAGFDETPPAGDRFVGDARRPFTQSGMWGLIRIHDPSCASACPEPL